jgi:hypothetical protein
VHWDVARFAIAACDIFQTYLLTSSCPVGSGSANAYTLSPGAAEHLLSRVTSGHSQVWARCLALALSFIDQTSLLDVCSRSKR